MVIAAAEGLIILDISFGSVVLDEVQQQFNTSIAALQGILAGYALIVAAFTLTGGSLGKRWGSHNTFRIGLVLRAIGAVVTACAFDVWSYGLGEAALAGVGMALVSPATSSMVGSLYSGKDNAKAFGMIGASIAIAGGVGPMLGGLIATELSWRWCNWFEFALCLVLLAGSFVIPRIPVALDHPRLDALGILTSAAAFTAIVLGLNQANEWGWWQNAGSPITVFGRSPTLFIVAGGVALLFVFAAIERRRSRLGLAVLLDFELLRNRELRSGLLATFSTQGALAGCLFVVPVYLQIVQGRSAFVSGLYLLPMAATAFLASMLWPRAAQRLRANTLGMIAGVAMLLCTICVYWDVEPALWGSTLLLGIAVFGIGSGIMDSQLDAITQASVPDERASEAAGLQCTADNFGSAIGIALVGTVLIISLSSGAQKYMRDVPVAPSTYDKVEVEVEAGVPMVDADTAEQFLEENGVPPSEVDVLTKAYRNSQNYALETALLAVGGLSIITIVVASRLPRKRLEEIEQESVDA